MKEYLLIAFAGIGFILMVFLILMGFKFGFSTEVCATPWINPHHVTPPQND